jgi:hypothetical protein
MRLICIPCFCMTERNLMMTLELGRIMHCLLPAFSALLIVLRASLRTEVLTILAVLDGSKQRGQDEMFREILKSVK